MTYVIQSPVEDGVLYYHTLTCCLLFLSNEEAERFIEIPELTDLWFVVPQAFDDRKLCLQVRSAARLLQAPARTVTDYTILPTTACNARCFYCYEQGTAPVTMSIKTAEKVAHYIQTHRGQEEVRIHWFGGEPLVNHPVIDRICARLRDGNVPFVSHMVSNGLLFDTEMILRAKELWQLKEVQITLDGMEQTYHRVKRFIPDNVNAFERVLDNIHLLTDAAIDVQIRLNVDMYNIDEMSELVTLLYRRFGANGHLMVYSRELYGKRAPGDSTTLYGLRMELEKRIAACGYRHKRRLLSDLKMNCCIADSDKSVVVSPAGFLGKCEHFIDRDFFGHIDNEEKDERIIRQFKERSDEIEACAACPVYPQCIRLKMCEKNYCTLELQTERILNTIEAMKDEYQQYINNQQHEA